MNAIFKKSFHFTKDKIEHSEKLGFAVRTVEAEVRVTASLNIQSAPDWIKETTLYKLGVKDKAIIGVTLEAAEAAQQPDTPPVPPIAPSGFGAGQQSQQTGFQPPQQPTSAGTGFTQAPAFGAGQTK